MHGSSISDSSRSRQRSAKISSFVASLLMLVFCQFAAAESAQDLANKMNTVQKVGQLMIWSFSGTDYSTQLDETLTKYQPGALILFRRNIKTNHQVAQLNGELQKAAAKKIKAPLFLMVDQEGGVVTRVRINTPIPSALALGKVSDLELVENFAHLNGDMLQALGFNVNLAPVMDVSNPAKDSFIGNRTFGDDASLVSNLSMAYAKGMNASGIVPTGKHFPGHGGTTTDSHQAVPKKMSSLEELDERDFVPFKNFASSAFPKLLMMAHLALPTVDASGVPATYSTIIIKDLLREKLGYRGVLITDDLEMMGAAVSGDIGERAVRAFIAGNDMLMLAGSQRNQRLAFKALMKAVNEGRISRDRLNESVVRILEAKQQLALGSSKIDENRALTAARKLEKLAKEVMQKNFKMALEQKKDWPEIKANTRAVVFSSSAGFSANFQKYFKGKTKIYPLTPQTIDSVADELTADQVSLAVFYASGSKTARWLSNLTPALKEKMIVINCNHSGEVEDQDNYLSVLNLNSHSPESGAWLAQELNKPPVVKPPESTNPEPLVEPTPDVRTPASEEELPASDSEIPGN